MALSKHAQEKQDEVIAQLLSNAEGEKDIGVAAAKILDILYDEKISSTEKQYTLNKVFEEVEKLYPYENATIIKNVRDSKAYKELTEKLEKHSYLEPSAPPEEELTPKGPKSGLGIPESKGDVGMNIPVLPDLAAAGHLYSDEDVIKLMIANAAHNNSKINEQTLISHLTGVDELGIPVLSVKIDNHTICRPIQISLFDEQLPQEVLPEAVLIKAVEATNDGKTSSIPVNLGGGHWTYLFVGKKEEQTHPDFIYFDPMGRNQDLGQYAGVPVQLRNAIKSLEIPYQIYDTGEKVQDSPDKCGARVVEASKTLPLLYAANNNIQDTKLQFIHEQKKKTDDTLVREQQKVMEEQAMRIHAKSIGVAVHGHLNLKDPEVPKKSHAAISINNTNKGSNLAY